MDVNPDRHTRWYQGIQRIYRNAVVKHLRATLRNEFPEDWEDVLRRPFAHEWPTIVENAHFARTIGVIGSPLRDAADYLGVNHFYNLFEVHFDLLFPEQGASTTEARRQEKAAVLGWAKEIKTARDPESHPPGEDMDFYDVVRQLDTARRICSKFDGQASAVLEALMSHLYSERPTDFGRGEREGFSGRPVETTPPNHLQAGTLALGPVQALGLGPHVEQAQQLASDAPADAARLYTEIADALREQFPRYAHRFERLRAAALRAAGDSEASHDLLMQLAVRDLWERAEPKLSPEVAADIDKLRSEVDAERQAQGRALVHFGGCHEYAGELENLAKCFESLEPGDGFAPVIAALFAEAALADRDFRFILDRRERLQSAAVGGDREIELRIRAALGDAGVPGVWDDLISRASSLRLPASEGTYLCLRGARWCAWNGQLDKAQLLYRLATKLGFEGGLDLDVENALWSLTVLYSLGPFSAEQFEEMSETNEMALSIEGSRSYVTANSRTQLRSYQYLANRQLPEAHLWAQYRLLESIRSGSLMDELNSHALLARVYGQSDEPLDALEHAVLGGSQQLVKEIAPSLEEWPQFLPTMVVSEAPWVRRSALLALEYVGDLAPAETARRLIPELLRQLHEAAYDARVTPALLKALGTLILEATDHEIEELIPFLQEYAVREPEAYRLTDLGVMTLAARLYRFRPTFRKQAAGILGEMSIGSHTGEWSRALDECGDDVGELIEAFERVSERENIDLAGVLSDLGHQSSGTRAVWLRRMQFVADHPLGQRTEHAIGPRYDVPAAFLEEQTAEAVLQYVDKLVAIGCDVGEFVLNRETALASAVNVIDTLSDSDKGRLFERVRPLVDQSVEISDADRFHASSQHPLSRFRISFGSPINVRTSAGRFLAGAATSSDEISAVVELALDWIRSDEPMLQGAGAAILALPNISSSAARNSELARHSNPSVREAAIWMSSMHECPEATIFEQLADDPDRGVRIAVAQALPHVKSMGPESYERIQARLKDDESALVRACATAL